MVAPKQVTKRVNRTHDLVNIGTKLNTLIFKEPAEVIGLLRHGSGEVVIRAVVWGCHSTLRCRGRGRGFFSFDRLSGLSGLNITQLFLNCLCRLRGRRWRGGGCLFYSRSVVKRRSIILGPVLHIIQGTNITFGRPTTKSTVVRVLQYVRPTAWVGIGRCNLLVSRSSNGAVTYPSEQRAKPTHSSRGQIPAAHTRTKRGLQRRLRCRVLGYLLRSRRTESTNQRVSNRRLPITTGKPGGNPSRYGLLNRFRDIGPRKPALTTGLRVHL